jgi:hypothetical protein
MDREVVISYTTPPDVAGGTAESATPLKQIFTHLCGLFDIQHN